MADQSSQLAPQPSLLDLNRAINHGGYDFQDPSSNPHRVTLKLAIPGQNHLLLVLQLPWLRKMMSVSEASHEQ